MLKERLNILSRDYSDLIKSMDNVLNNKTISLKDIKEYNINCNKILQLLNNRLRKVINEVNKDKEFIFV